MAISHVHLTAAGQAKTGHDETISTNEENIQYKEDYIVVKCTGCGNTYVLKPEDIHHMD
jgi:hypothetical protein